MPDAHNDSPAVLPPRESSVVTVIFLALLCAAAWALRMLPWRQVFTPEGIFFYEADPYYHLRRIMLIVQHFPQVPVFDRYMAYPEGAYCFWPPLFDFSIACAAMVAGCGHPSQRLVETVAALAPPVIGAITVIPVFFLARMIFNRAAAFIAAMAIALMPGHIAYSTIGRVDHHVAETLFFVLASLFLLKALVTPSTADVEPQLAPRRSSFIQLLKAIRLWSVAAGVAMAAMFLVQSASTLYAAALFGFIAIQAIVTITRREDPSPLLANGAVAFGVAAIMLLPFCNLDPWIGSSAVLRLSWFHLALLSGAALGSALWAMLWKMGEGKHSLIMGVLLSGVALAIAAGAIFTIAPGLWNSLEVGLAFFGRSDPWARTIVESRPLFRSIEVLPPTAFAEVELSWGLYLVPVALGLILYREKPASSPPTLYLIVATLAVGGFAFMQQRFVNPFSVFVSLCIGYLVALAPSAITLLLRPKPLSAGFAAAIQGLTFILIMYPSFSYFAPLWRSRYEAADRFFTVPPEFYDAAKWLRHATPPTLHFDSPSAIPEYGVLCEWDKGHWIEYIAQRPVLANNFGSHLGRQEFVDSIKFYLARSEPEAMAIVRRYNVRYVVTAPLWPNVQDYAAIAGQTRVTYVQSDSNTRTLRFSPSYASLIGVQLHECDGRSFDLPAGKDLRLKGPRLPHFRLVYEGNRPDTGRNEVREIPIKVFEVVKGARVKGHAEPSATVTASTKIVTNTGRSFEYVATAMTDKQGDFEMLLPYPTDGAAKMPVRAQGDYTLTCGSQKATLRVPESVAEAGGTVQVTFPQ